MRGADEQPGKGPAAPIIGRAKDRGFFSTGVSVNPLMSQPPSFTLSMPTILS